MKTAEPPSRADDSIRPSAFSVSVLICTRNRAEELRRALRSVERSTLPIRQVVVSDDSTDERTRTLVAEEFPGVSWVRGPGTGLGANRNRALRHATGSHVLFIDDDVELAPDFLARLRELWETLPERDRHMTIIAGSELQGTHRVTPNEQSVLGFQSRPYGSDEPLRTVVMNGAVFPREVFSALRFDEQLVYGYDEVDITTRAVAAGYRIEPCFEASNRHSPSEANRDYYRPHVEASRLYVTRKRLRRTEGRPAAALAFWLLAAVHTLASSMRRRGPAGLASGLGTLRLARRMYRNHLSHPGGTV